VKTLASTVNCPYCGKLTDPNLDGCPHCGGYIKKKVGAAQPTAKKKINVHCPSCKGPVEEGDIICVACGTNLLTGQKISSTPKLSESADDSSFSLDQILKWLIAATVIILLGIGLFVLTNDPVKKARKLVANGQYPEAQELLAEHVIKSPEDAEAFMELGKLQYHANQRGEATTSFKRAYDLNPTNVEAGLFSILSMHQIESSATISQQIKVLESITANAPDHVQSWYLLGMAYGARGGSGDHAKQIEALEQVILLSPSMESAQLALGIAETLQGNYTQAKQHLSGITKSSLQANSTVSQGYIASYENDQRSSLNHFQSALASGDLNMKTESQLQLAKLNVQSGDFVRADEYLQEVLQADPINQLARYLLGLTLSSRGKANEALAQFQSLIKANLGYEGQAAVQAAGLQLLLNDPDGAQRSISIARRSNEESPAYYTVQGRIYVANEYSEQARRSFDTAIKMDPSYASAYLERGLFHIAQSDLDSGLNDLNSYLKIVGSDMNGTRVREIRMLATQLHNTLKG